MIADRVANRPAGVAYAEGDIPNIQLPVNDGRSRLIFDHYLASHLPAAGLSLARGFETPAKARRVCYRMPAPFGIR